MPKQHEDKSVTVPEFDAAESWSVEYIGVPYDDAREIADVWYYRDAATGEIRRFAWQDRLVPLAKNG